MTRFTRALRSRTAAVASAAGAAAVLTATFVQAQPAAALPRPQAVCDLGTIAITAARGYVPLDSYRSDALGARSVGVLEP